MGVINLPRAPWPERQEELALAVVRSQFMSDRIDVAEFEQRVAGILDGTSSPFFEAFPVRTDPGKRTVC